MPDVRKYPTLIWLNGGPGSSSQLGNLMELGPFWILPDKDQPYTVVRNNWTWVREYNILFVDQPVGTGLSYADVKVEDPYVHNMSGKSLLIQRSPKTSTMLSISCMSTPADASLDLVLHLKVTYSSSERATPGNMSQPLPPKSWRKNRMEVS